MTTTRLSNRRGPPPHLHSPNSPQPSSSKPSVSLEEWESKAPLGELENTSVAAVKAAFDRPSLPFKFTVEEASSRASTPLRSVKFGPPSRSSTPGIPPSVTSISTSARFPGLSSATSTASTPHPYSHLHPTAPIQTPQQFYDWFALIDRSVAHSQESHFREHLKGVEDWLGVCEMLVGRIEEVDEEVEGMLKGWRSVEEGGRSLQEACQRLLEERDRLVELQDAIGQRLDYFQELEQATRMLNHPGDSLVLQTDFLYMVERVDVCIDFLKAHRHFREAELYLLRFQQCMTRAMTLIKMFFVGSLRALTQDITRRLSEKDVSSTAQQHLLYTRFQSVSHQLAPLLSELERRAASHPDQLSALLQECHTAWFAARKGIVVRRLVEEVRGLEVGRGELVEVTRAGCSYLKQLCTDEWELYRSFFDSGEEELYAYLESLCDYLYDDLRPRILHEQKLGALCEVCTVLQALMVLDGPSITAAESSTSPSASDSGSDDDSLEIVPDLPEDFKSSSKENGLGDLRISGLLRMVLQDAQTRLVFKAQSVMQSEIRWFIPNANAGTEELDWPGVLIRARDSHDTNLIVKDKDSESIELGLSQIFQLSEATRRGVNTWYPTVRKTVWVLSQLFEFVQPAIFADLAQESLNLCRLSLISASEVIKSKSSFHSHSHSKSHSKSSASKAHAKSQSQIQSPPPPPHPTSPSTEIKTSPAGAELRDPETLIGLGKELDAVLFLARHLLILKEMARGLEGLMKSLEAEGGATGAAVKSVGGGYAFGGTNTSGFVGDGAVGVGAAGGLTGGSGMTDAFTSMLSRTSALIPDSLFESLGMPRGQESMLDARHGIDIDLRKACQDLIELVSSNATDPLYTYLAHAQRTASALILPPSTSTSSSSAFSANTTTSPPPTSSSSGMLPSDQSQRADTPLKSVEKEFVARCQTALKDSISRIRIYVEDQRTADVLIEHVRERVEDGWEVFREGVMQVQGEKQDTGLMSEEEVRGMLRGVCSERGAVMLGGSDAMDEMEEA